MRHLTSRVSLQSRDGYLWWQLRTRKNRDQWLCSDTSWHFTCAKYKHTPETTSISAPSPFKELFSLSGQLCTQRKAGLNSSLLWQLYICVRGFREEKTNTADSSKKTKLPQCSKFLHVLQASGYTLAAHAKCSAKFTAHISYWPYI